MVLFCYHHSLLIYIIPCFLIQARSCFAPCLILLCIEFGQKGELLNFLFNLMVMHLVPIFILPVEILYTSVCVFVNVHLFAFSPFLSSNFMYYLCVEPILVHFLKRYSYQSLIELNFTCFSYL